MTPEIVNLYTRISSLPPGVLSITGGGGKSTLLFSLAKAFTEAGTPVICTTTTRMFKPDASDCLDVSLTNVPQSLVPGKKALFAARPGGTESPDKVSGFPAVDICELSKRNPGVWILVEADGAARLPLKAPAAHEPVVPLCTTVFVAVLGLQCMYQSVSPKTVFRMNEVSAITGLKEGDTITPGSLAPLIRHPDGLFKSAPKESTRFLLCNQSDLPGAEESGLSFAAEAAPGYLDGFFIASLKTKGLECLSCPTA